MYGFEIPTSIDDILHSATNESREPENNWCNEYYSWADSNDEDKPRTHRTNIENFREFGLWLINGIASDIQGSFASDDAFAFDQNSDTQYSPDTYEAGICSLMALVYEKATDACREAYLKCCDDLEAWHIQNGSIDNEIE